MSLLIRKSGITLDSSLSPSIFICSPDPVDWFLLKENIPHTQPSLANCSALLSPLSGYYQAFSWLASLSPLVLVSLLNCSSNPHTLSFKNKIFHSCSCSLPSGRDVAPNQPSSLTLFSFCCTSYPFLFFGFCLSPFLPAAPCLSSTWKVLLNLETPILHSQTWSTKYHWLTLQGLG